MQPIKNQLLPIERMTPEPGHYFFGYYDIPAWSADDSSQLCHRVAFRDRLPASTDRAEIGMVRGHNGPFIPLAETFAWNFQQGSMLQWNPLKPNDEIIYNALIDGEFKAVVQNIVTGEKRVVSRAVANVDPSGRWGLSVNFSRQFDFRPGYGYAGIDDPFKNEAAPADDGIYLVDMVDGASKLILPLESGRSYFSHIKPGADKLVVNHITFNPDGSRFVALIRHMALPGYPPVPWPWQTVVITANRDGTDLHRLIGPGDASHYRWRDPEHILFWARPDGHEKLGLFLFRDRTNESESIDSDYFTFDGHCSYSPDKNFILYDSYPDKEAYRHLILYDLRKRKGSTLASLRSEHMDSILVDIRCDLHPRWNRAGTAISFDSIHDGDRHMYRMDLSSLVGSS